jgi:hypothetical protein
MTTLRNVANYFPQTLASTIVLSYQTSLPGEISHKWKSHHDSFATQIFHFFSSSSSPPPPSSRRVRRFTLTAVVLNLLQQLGSLSPTLQRLILHTIQPMICGGLFLLGYLMNRHPLSFIALGVVIIGFVVLILRAVWKDYLEKKENELILETLQEESRRKQENRNGNEREGGGGVEGLEGKPAGDDSDFSDEEIPPLPSPSPLARDSSRSSSHSGRPGSNSIDGSDRESFSSRGRRYSSSAEDLRASYLGAPSSLATGGGRNRVNSVESTGSLPYRMRGSSVDSVGSGPDSIWRSPSFQTEYFNELIIDEREERSSDDQQQGSYGRLSPEEDSEEKSEEEDDQEDSKGDEEIQIIVRVNEHRL